MKIQLNKLSRQQGFGLALTLVVTALIGFLLVAYLTLVRSQNVSNMRSQSWNQAIPVIEAGVEDALTHLNTHGLTNLACDNWQSLGSIYYMKRWVGESYYVVTISNWVANAPNVVPVVESRGFVTMPTIMAATPGPFLADSTGPNAIRYLGRGVRVNTKSDWLFSKGLVAKGKIDLNGNDVASDSFDSSTNTASTGGQYDPAKRRDHGDIATNSGLTNSIDIANADIWGHVSTGPKGSVSIGPQGSVGDLSWHTLMRKGIKPGWTNDDMNVDFPDVDPPFDGGYDALTGGTNADDSTYYKYLIDESGNYKLDVKLTLSGSETLFVKSNVNAVLYVTDDISISGTAKIYIQPGGSLKLYMGGATADLGGNGVINNGGNATNFGYFGLTNNTSLAIGGNGSFIGTVYAPSANYVLKGGGSSDMDIIGAAVVGTATLNGHFNFHYDEALAKFGPFRRFIVTRWDEMPPDQVTASAIDTTTSGVIH